MLRGVNGEKFADQIWNRFQLLLEKEIRGETRFLGDDDNALDLCRWYFYDDADEPEYDGDDGVGGSGGYDDDGALVPCPF